MIEIDKLKCTADWEMVIEGMRNAMNSWDRSDSFFLPLAKPSIGENDLELMKKLVNAGPEHSKFMRAITCCMNITAPLYFWKEFDTYKIGTVSLSTSTMHKIHAKEFEIDDFSHDHLGPFNMDQLEYIVSVLNANRDVYLRTKSKEDWWEIIQMLPSTYNQKRTIFLNYAVLRNIYFQRRNHKLDEWRELCDKIKELPYSELITLESKDE